jgi:Response regulator containing CheY-like receiver domain and AraC-type DNA-binding domain
MKKQAIVCVDDEPLILLALKHELSRRFGSRFIYETASDAADALEVIEDLVADGVEIVLIISDWLMPGMRGDEFLRLVHERFPAVGEIVISGQADEVALQRLSSECGLLGYFKKPYDAAKVFKAIDDHFKALDSGRAPL